MLLYCTAVAVLPSETDCFKHTQKLVGYRSTNQFRLILEPQETLSQLCTSFDQRASTASVKIDGIQSDLVPQSESITVNMSSQYVVYTFQLVDSGGQTAGDIFDQIEEKVMAEYTVLFYDSVNISGTIQQIVFRTLDSTSCWSDSTI